MSSPSSKPDNFSAGASFAQYQIIRKIGQGGMGVVYLALDNVLERQVALKFLLPDKQDRAARHRLLAEAKAAASVDHPYICKIYQTGEVDGTVFISMEFIEGKTLADHISENRSLPIKDVLRISCEIAEALAKAHQRRLIHRDIKPLNVLLTAEGHVKITDFGLARSFPEDGLVKTLTYQYVGETKGLLGTPAYMSPEQARGLHVDSQTDLFSFGIVLYEMLTGEFLFKRPTIAATLKAVVSDVPVPPCEIRKDCPEGLQTIINRLLAKGVSDRYRNAQDVLLDLRAVHEGKPILTSPLPSAVESPGALVDPRSLAVLPFSNLSTEEANEFFSDGITEELIARIGRVRELRVISRTSVMRYKRSSQNLRSIAHELGVANVLEGSVRRSGTRVRIVARLVDVEKDHQIWSEIYDRELSDIFAVQAEVCSQISAALSTNVSSDAQRIQKVSPGDPAAYSHYLMGRHFLNRLSPDDIGKGIRYFQDVLTQDPSYANAYAGLAKSYAYCGHFSFLPVDEAYPKARAAALEALRLDADLAEANTAVALIAMLYDWDWNTAERAFARSLQLNSNDGETRVFYSWYLQAMGRITAAVVEAELALRLDPLSPVTNTNLAHCLILDLRYEDGIRQLRKTLEIEPAALHAKYLIGTVYACQGKFDEAISILADESMPSHSRPLLAWTYALAGRHDDAREVLQKLVESSPPTGPWTGIAMTCLLLGDQENAAAWLERAYSQRESQLMHMRCNPLVSTVHNNPKLMEIHKRMGLLR